MKKQLLYWIPTTILLFFMVGSAIYYFVDTPAVSIIFTQLGYPVYTLYFNAVAKILGGIAIVFPVSRTLKEWAYAGYLFILLMALQAVWMTSPGVPYAMFGFIAVWSLSYWGFRQRSFM